MTELYSLKLFNWRALNFRGSLKTVLEASSLEI